MRITGETIRKGLRDLGLREGDAVLVHSALSAIGDVEGGADAVIGALLAAVGPTGTVMMPYPLGGAAIAGAFTARPDTVKSGHPTHSVTAWGARAREFVRDHLASPTAAGAETPFGRLAAAGGYILLLGVDQDRNTTLHTAEEYADLPYLSDRTVTWTDGTGTERTMVLKKYPGPHRNFIGMDGAFRRAGVMRIGRIGGAVARLIDARGMLETALAALADDPAAFLCDNPNCADCVMQRGKIRAARLAEETFVLTAVNDEILPGIAGLADVLQGEGIARVELRSVDERMAADLDDGRAREIAGALAAGGVAVSGLRTDLNRARWDADPAPNLDRLERCLRVAVRLNARYLVVSSFAADTGEKDRARDTVIGALAGMADRCARAGVALLVENAPGTYCAGSGECADVVRSAACPNLRLAFNPANFARAGEKPFLGVPPAVRRLTALLYVNDALFSGPAQPPGRGNAEIKELVSILRCRSFAGHLSLLPGLGQDPGAFRNAAAAFRRLLETM